MRAEERYLETGAPGLVRHIKKAHMFAVVPLSKPAVKCFASELRAVHNLAVKFLEKIIPLEKLPSWRREIRSKGKKLVVTNGCFDILHVGHVTYLELARQYGDVLLVGVNSDSSVRQLKGEGRPVNCENDRATVLAALACVDAVCIFNDVRATRLLAMAEPDVWVKGGDYTLQTLDQDERRVVEQVGGKIVILPQVPGKSTTGLLEKIGSLCPGA